MLSHPSWVCGLKHILERLSEYGSVVTSFVGVWIETQNQQQNEQQHQSHPSWVCGLKPSALSSPIIPRLSHPSWVCGLKHWYAVTFAKPI